MRMVKHCRLAIFCALSVGLSGCLLPPGPQPREVRLKGKDTVVVQALPYSGLSSTHYVMNGAGGEYSRAHFDVTVGSRQPPYVVNMSPGQILALDRQLQREFPLIVELEFVDASLYKALELLKDPFKLTTIVYYSHNNDIMESTEEGEFVAVK